MKHNVFIQEELERYLREDEKIISTLQRKRILPNIDNFANMRESRKNTERTARSTRPYDHF